jgi:alpha-L-rhamnosidase
MAEILGKKEDIPLLESMYNAEKEYFNTRFGGELTTQTAMALALDLDLLPAERKQEVASNLDKHIREQRNVHLCTGFLGTPHLLHALSANGYTDTAWKLLEQKSCPSWLFPVLNGATTIWERWDSWTPKKGFQDPKMNSFNHYAYGAVLDWIIGVAAGISPDFDIDPHPGGTLSFMEVEYKGFFVRWEKDEKEIRYTVKVPAGIKAKFRGEVLENKEVYHFTENIR